MRELKVAQLIELTRAARGSVIVVSDANVRVPRGYLSSIIEALLRPGVGLVPSVIAGSGERTFGAALENAQLGAGVARRWWPRTASSVGPSPLVNRWPCAAPIWSVPGVESVAGVLAEDDVLGQKFHALGYGVELCLDAVENRNVSCSALRSIDRHARWAKMRRAIVPSLLFLFEPLISPFIVAVAVAVLATSALSLQLCAFALALQVIGALLAHTGPGRAEALAPRGDGAVAIVRLDSRAGFSPG